MAKPRSSQEAEEEAIENQTKEEATENRQKKKANKKKPKEEATEKRQKKKANKEKPKEEAIETLDSSSIVNPGTKRTASTHEPSDHPQKPRKRPRKKTHVEEGAENVNPQLHQTPSTKRLAPSAGLVEQGATIYASNMEELRLKPADEEAQPKLTVESVKKIGDGNWEEALFGDRLSKALSDEVLCGLKLLYSGTKTLPDANTGKEVPSKPDFVLHVGEESKWANVELLFEHTRSKKAVGKKFPQWLRGAWSIFHHQPFRLHLYGIMFIQPYAYVCYADHGCAVYSEPLDFVKNNRHTHFLIDFLTGFIANQERCGRNPIVAVDELDRVRIRHADTTWVESTQPPLYYRPCLVGRHIRVARVLEQGGKFPEGRMVMKSTWEERLPPASSPPSEVEVLKILLKANVRGLPQPYDLDSAILRDDGNLEVETRSFPENCKVALSASTENFMKMRDGYASKHLSNPWPPVRILSIPCYPESKFLRLRDDNSMADGLPVF